ncbi:MAG: mechanosensitive ion channel family protein [Chitinophagales bacterium]
MDKIITSITESLSTIVTNFMEGAPRVLGALLLLIIGRYVGKFVTYLVKKALNKSKFDTIADRFNASEMLEKGNIEMTPTELIAKFIYWIILLFFFVLASESLGLTIVSQKINELINFIPSLFSALVIFTIGAYIASFFREVINATTASLGFSGGRFIGSFVFYFFMIIITLTALDQIGVDTSIIKNNLILIIGAVLLAGSISYGIASRHVLSNILASYFSRKTFEVGQVIRLDDIEGEIVKIDSVAITIQTKQNKVIVPTQELIMNRIHLLKEAEK